MKKIKTIFKCSIAINGLFLLLFTGYIAKKVMERNVHYQKVLTVPTDSMLLKFNNEPLNTLNDTINVGSSKTISILFLGNSITRTEAAYTPNDQTPRGMCSSSIQKDYVHLLTSHISKSKKVNIHYSVVNIADFERNYKEFEKHYDSFFSNIANLSPDFLIVQIGENVNGSDLYHNMEDFVDSYVNLLNKFEKSTKIITLPFWQSELRNEAISSVAMQANAIICDLSHIGCDDTNKAVSDHYDNVSEGVASHPGDEGMEDIAICLMSIFNGLNI